jgi:hypothetical protein
MLNCMRCVWEGTTHWCTGLQGSADACIGMYSNIIKKFLTCISHNFLALSLLGCYSTDGRKNGRVNHTFVIEKCPNDILPVCVCVFSDLRLRLGYCKCMRYQSLVPSR